MRRSSSPIVLLALPVYVPSLTWSTGIGALNSVVVLAGLSMQMSESWASAMVGIMGVAGVIASVPIGRMVDRIGDRSSFVIGGLIAVLAGTCALVCLRFPGINRAVVAFVIAMVAISIAGDIWQLARQSYVAESVPMTWRARSMSMLGGMSRIGRLIGPALASLAIVLGGIPGTFWFLIAATVLALSLILLFTAPTPEILDVKPPASQRSSSETPPASLQRRPRTHVDVVSTMLLSVGTVLLSLVRTNQIIVVPLVGTSLGITEELISATFAISAGLDVAVFYFSGAIMDRFGRRASVLPCLLIMAAGFVGLALSGGVVSFMVSACVVGFGNGFSAGTVMTMGVDLSPDINRSRFLGIWQAISQVGPTVGPFVISVLVAAWGATMSAWATAVAAACCAVWMLVTVPTAYARLGMDERGRALPAQSDAQS